MSDRHLYARAPGALHVSSRFPALLLPALVGCAVVVGLAMLEHLAVGDRLLDAGLERQRSLVADVTRRAAAARTLDARAREALAGAGALIGEARRILSSLEVPAEPWVDPPAVESEVLELDRAWRATGRSLEAAATSVTALAELADVVETYEAGVARLLVDTARLGEALSTADADPGQIHASTRQLLLAQRLETSARRLVSDRDGLLGTADRLGRDTIVFGEVNNALLSGNDALGLERVSDLDARALLERVGRQWRESTTAVERIVGLVAVGAENAAALGALDAAVARTTAAVDALAQAHVRVRSARDLTPASLRVLAAFAVLAVLLAMLLDARRARRQVRERAEHARMETERLDDLAARDAREAEAEAREARTKSALESLAAGLDAWSRGALAAPIAGLDALPSPLALSATRVREELAPLLEELREFGLHLGTLASTARGAASRVAGMADDQNERMEVLARSARDVTASLEPLAAHCAEVGERATQTDACVRAVAGGVRGALDGVMEARAAVAETAGRVARASEELGVLRDLAETLEELGDRSKLLSVNVAIQASMDTESGRALANFADEVQRVSERARYALRRMESADEQLRRLLGDAVDAVKRGRWALDSASDGAALARPSIDTLEGLAAEARSRQPALDDAARAHTEQVAEAVRGLKAVQSLAVEIRASAFAASDTSVRIEESAHRAALAAERLDPAAGAPAAVVELGLGASPVAADESGNTNVRALRPPEPPVGA